MREKALDITGADIDTATEWLEFRCSLSCLIRGAEERDKLDESHRKTLECILVDPNLNERMDTLLADALELRDPEALLLCLKRHEQTAKMLSASFDSLLEGLP